MRLRPLPGKVIIRPQPRVEQTDSGLHLVEHRKPDQIGTVIAIGKSKCAKCATNREADFTVGDVVLFSWSVGQEVVLNDGEDRLLEMWIDDVLAVIEPVGK